MSIEAFTNHAEVDKFIQRFMDNSPKLRVALLKKVAKNVLRLIAQFAPRDTGEYASSWKVLSMNDKVLVIGSPMSTLYVVLEFGVDHPVTITAKTARALHWVDPTTGQDRFAKSVTIPPRKAQPHIRTAQRDTMRDVPKLAVEAIKETYPFVK